jgi:hypothetical protein
VAKAGVVPTDPQARRLAAVLPGVSEEAVQLYQPLVLPVAISVLGLLLISAGAHSPKPKKVKNFLAAPPLGQFWTRTATFAPMPARSDEVPNLKAVLKPFSPNAENPQAVLQFVLQRHVPRDLA